MYLSPGGLRGFYTHGICKFIRYNYDLSNYTYYGASAGAWNSLYMSVKPNKESKFESLLLSSKASMCGKCNLYNIQINLRHQILKDFTTQDFDLTKPIIQTYEWNNIRLRKKNYGSFDDLDDIIKCCMASSHIPLLSGRVLYKYKGKYCVDGGIYGFMEQKDTENIVIYPEMFGFDFSNKDKPHNFDANYLANCGYSDAKNNCNFLDKYLIK